MSDDAERLGRLERERANVIERMQRAEAETARLRAELDAAQAQARVAHASQAVAWSYYRRTRTQRDRGHALRRRAAQRAIGLRGRLGETKQRVVVAEAAVEMLRVTLVRGLGLANELGEGERWATWRLAAHTVLTSLDAGEVILHAGKELPRE
jgi:multidrug efflux pump subunit AcrA (membrane-fusion protein)